MVCEEARPSTAYTLYIVRVCGVHGMDALVGLHNQEGVVCEEG